MINNYKNKAIVVLSVIAILAFGAYAFADWGMGYSHPGRDHHGRGHYQGMHNRGWANPGNGHMMGDLSEEQIRKLDKERNAFYEATKDLRQEIYGKELELRTELSRTNPDAKKAASLQKEISKLEAQISQKKIDHMIAVKKINPNAGQGFMERGQKGYGSSYRGSCRR